MAIMQAVRHECGRFDIIADCDCCLNCNVKFGFCLNVTPDKPLDATACVESAHHGVVCFVDHAAGRESERMTGEVAEIAVIQFFNRFAG